MPFVICDSDIFTMIRNFCRSRWKCSFLFCGWSWRLEMRCRESEVSIIYWKMIGGSLGEETSRSPLARRKGKVIRNLQVWSVISGLRIFSLWSMIWDWNHFQSNDLWSGLLDHIFHDLANSCYTSESREAIFAFKMLFIRSTKVSNEN